MRVIEQTVGQFDVPVVLGNNSRAAGPALPLATRRVEVVQADLGVNAAALGAVALLLRPRRACRSSARPWRGVPHNQQISHSHTY
ncbi:hypothetical protein OG322_39555 [Streptomyces sp. NBC_01260]|uniref:hypothetical protein n=1 Tax=Streptomyces sp. NBC_01260 TaxID=2903801 RepID=UPI002E341214|nr:hypothetical protein [Streptomyces sp. NBC_01260]